MKHRKAITIFNTISGFCVGFAMTSLFTGTDHWKYVILIALFTIVMSVHLLNNNK